VKWHFLNKVIDEALRAGAQEAEIYFIQSKGITIEVKDKETEAFESFDESGYGLRIIKDGKVGFSYSTQEEQFKGVISKALASSKYVATQEENKLPKRNNKIFHDDVEIFDKKINLLTPKDAFEKVLSMERSALKEKYVNRVRKAVGSFYESSTFIKNSLGIEDSFKSTEAVAKILLVAENGQESYTGWDFEANRFIDNIDFEQIGITASKRATSMFGARKISSLKGYVVLDSISAINFLTLMSSSFSSDSVQKGRSILKGKIGEKIISDKIDIIDSANKKGLIGTRPFDAEGLYTGETVVIEKGYLKSFLYNSYTASREGVQSTGNAVRAGFKSLPLVGINNLYLKASDATQVLSKDEIIKAIDRGVYVTEILGMHTTNPITGDFSVGISGLWIQKGGFIHPFKEAVISGNIFKLFNKVALIGDDLKFYGNIGAPTLLIEQIDINA